jgi:Flp pilus assembly protein TadG
VSPSQGRVRRGRGEPGQAAVEFALVLPLLVMAVLAVIQVGLVVRDHLAVIHAAREAAREASVQPDPARAVAAARRTLPDAQVEVAPRPAIGEPIEVEVTYRSVTDVPLVGRLFPDPVLRSRAVMRVER